MKNVLRKCFIQADKTFSLTNKDLFANNLALLIGLVDGLSLKDVVSKNIYFKNNHDF